MFGLYLKGGLFKYVCRSADDNVVARLEGAQGNIEGKWAS